MNIAPDAKVSFHYTLQDAEGQTIDSSEGRDPLSYIHGHGQIVGGLESALEGRVSGDHVDVVVAASDGYGAFNKDLVVQIALEAFPEEARGQLQPGVQFQGPHPQDENQGAIYRVVELQDEAVVADANHPLAGVDLHFSVDVVTVDEASPEELAQVQGGQEE
ncbi:MAG: peptidylprolyl isomerase [Planctomycetota bacterium]|nr:MAG: peptidylprolyl isomerase [Planctomycetota bacterium]